MLLFSWSFSPSSPTWDFLLQIQNAEMQTTWPLGTSHSPDKDLSIFTDRSLAFCILHLHATVLDRLCMQLPHPIRPSHLRLNITTCNINSNFLNYCWLISEFFSFLRIYAWKNLTLGQVGGLDMVCHTNWTLVQCKISPWNYIRPLSKKFNKTQNSKLDDQRVM